MMTTTECYLASRPSERNLRISASSSSALGLGISDIIQRGLVAPRLDNSTYEPAQLSTLAERIFQALADAKIWTSRVAMRLDLESRNRYFRQLDLLHDCEEWFGDDQPLQLESYKSFIRFMMKNGGNSKPSLALNPNGNLLAVWEMKGNRLTIEFKASDRLLWVVSCADGDRTAGSTSLSTIKSRLSPYDPETWFGVG